jgi:hypothetical protein
MAANSRQNQRDDALALGLARGLSVRGAAKSSGYSERHAHRRLAAGNCEAARTLRKLLKDGSSSIQLAAAKALLDLGARMRETLELERRVSDLEQSLKEPDDES